MEPSGRRVIPSVEVMGSLQVSVCAEDGVSLATSQVEGGGGRGAVVEPRLDSASPMLNIPHELYIRVFTFCAAVSRPGTALLSHIEQPRAHSR